jgi:hypothetical protein
MRRLHDAQDGSSLTEFAIVAPLFIMLVMWSQFFTDFGIFKLKVQEAARYGLWEMTAQRPMAQVRTEITDRFKDLASPEGINNAQPTDALSFTSGIAVAIDSFTDNEQAPFTNQKASTSGSGGLAGSILSKIMSILGEAVNKVAQLYGLELEGRSRISLTFTGNVKLFPVPDVTGGQLGNQLATVTAKVVSPRLVVNTWKAWPGKYAKASKSLETSPYDTYASKGADSAPEREVAKRLDSIAYFGATMGQITQILDKVLQFLQLPGVFLRGTWKSGGPVAMFPGDVYSKGWSPASGKPIQRVGDELRTDRNKWANLDSPDRKKTDRARFTSPGVAMNTDYWTGKQRGGDSAFGANTKVSNYHYAGLRSKNENPYRKAFECRDGYYLGARVSQVDRFGRTLRQWAEGGGTGSEKRAAYGNQCKN